MPTETRSAPTDATTFLHGRVGSCIDALVASSFRCGRRAGWMHWQLTAQGEPTVLRAGSPTLYDGDLGAAWACAELGAALDRADLVDVAVAVAADAIGRAESLPPGLLGGVHGVALAAREIERLTGTRLPGVAVPDAATVGQDDVDLAGGAAGLLLVASREDAELLLARLERRACKGQGGWCWPGEVVAGGDPAEGRALTGLAHGASGIALAAAQTAARFPDLAGRAARVVRNALAWERAWFDPVAGGWPDRRCDPPTWPVLWCHGAAGIGGVRLRLLALDADGLDLGVPREALLADAEAAVQACGRSLGEAAVGRAARGDSPVDVGPASLPAGLTLCHGLGGVVDVLLLAGRTWGAQAHVDAARTLTADVVSRLPENPLEWPAGVRRTGGAGLLLGLAGTAWVLARVAHPELPLGCPSLLGLC